MALTLEQIIHEIDALCLEDKFQLLEHLQEQLSPEIDRIWAEEADARFKSIIDGTSKTIPAEQIFADLRAELSSKR